jgi:hypothetical protein
MNTGQALDFSSWCSSIPGSRARPAPRNDDIPAFFRTLLDEILRRVAPAEVLGKPYLLPKHDPEFVVRGIWHLYAGWFDGRGWATMEMELDQGCASFEASLCEAPQDEDLI